MITANSSVLQLGTETNYGTAVVPTIKVNYSSCDLKPTINKKDEGLLTGGLTGGKVETMSKKTEGTISTLAKPETVGYFLKNCFGVEAEVTQDTVTNKSAHTFTPIGNGESDYLPSVTGIFDRGTGAKAYTGLTLDSISFSAQPEDYLTLEAKVIGRDEVAGTLVAGLVAETGKALKFRQGKAYIGSTEIADVTSIKFEYNNNVSSLQTTSTGLYFTQPQPGQRELTSDIELVYGTNSETLRNSYWLTDDSFSLRLEFTDESSNALILTIPAVQATAFDEPTMSGTDTLKQSFTVKAIDSASKLVTALLQNDRTTAY